MDKAAQIAVRPPVRRAEPPPKPESQAAVLRARLEGYTEGREMKRLVEQQRSRLIHAMEQILVTDSIETACEIARTALDAVSGAAAA